MTGSKFLVTTHGKRVLVDCGLFQGVKQLRRRNWARLPVPPGDIDAVLLTHAHLDHSGFLPILVREGFAGPIYCTEPTVDLCEILLRDAGRIQEEDARYANRKGYSRHNPAEPLFTEKDAQAVLPHLRPVPMRKTIKEGGLRFEYTTAGHILGAASVRILDDAGPLLFSGDIGTDTDPLMGPPAKPQEANWVVMESTYGDRRRASADLVDVMEEVLKDALARGGILLIPSFAVARAQLILLCVELAFRRGNVPRVPLFLDSPMATDVTRVYRHYARFHRLSVEKIASVFRQVQVTRSPDESMVLNAMPGPAVIVSSSGMLTGGRVMHHIKHRAPQKANTIFLPGFQAPGTRGAALVAGADSLKVHGQYVEVRARVVQSDLFSAHADQDGLIEWAGSLPRSPKTIFLVHGEPAAADELRRRFEEKFAYKVHIPEHKEEVEL